MPTPYLTKPLRSEDEVRRTRQGGVNPAAVFDANAFFGEIPADEWTPKIDPPSRMTKAMRRLVYFGAAIVLLYATFYGALWAVGQMP